MPTASRNRRRISRHRPANDGPDRECSEQAWRNGRTERWPKRVNRTRQYQWYAGRRSDRRSGGDSGDDQLSGPTEVDDAYMGNNRANTSNAKRTALKGAGGCETVGKTAFVGIKDRDNNDVRTQVVEDADKSSLHGFVK